MYVAASALARTSLGEAAAVSRLKDRRGVLEWTPRRQYTVLLQKLVSCVRQARISVALFRSPSFGALATVGSLNVYHHIRPPGLHQQRPRVVRSYSAMTQRL